MDEKDILSTADTSRRLIQDDEYYRYIFKKTERIVSVVFYILHNLPEDTRTQMHLEDIRHAARQVHDAIIQSLETRVQAAEDAVRVSALSLIALESKLNVAHVAGVIGADVIGVLRNEIETVLRGLNRYMKREQPILGDMRAPEPVRRKPREQRTAPSSRTEYDMAPNQSRQEASDRREQIVTILKARGTATIKDIANVIKDVSEKTIQRELNAMIEDNIVQRHGERRWSTYSTVS